MSEPSIENHAIFSKLCAKMESQLFTKNETATTGSINTIASIVTA